MIQTQIDLYEHFLTLSTPTQRAEKYLLFIFQKEISDSDKFVIGFKM